MIICRETAIKAVVPVLLVTVLMFTGCGEKSDIIKHDVDLVTSDGFNLKGTVYSPLAHEKLPGVVLAHMYQNSRASWEEYARKLASQGFIALSFDFRACGQSEGDSLDVGNQYLDFIAAAEFLAAMGRVDRGRIAAVGASMGGMAAVIAASKSSLIKAVVTICAPPSWQGSEPIEVVHKISPRPILFIGARNDSHLTLRATRAMYLRAGDPRKFVLLDTNRHGTDIFATDLKDKLEQLITDFLTEHLKAAGTVEDEK